MEEHGQHNSVWKTKGNVQISLAFATFYWQIHWIVKTFCRTKEIAGAKWDQIHRTLKWCQWILNRKLPNKSKNLQKECNAKAEWRSVQPQYPLWLKNLNQGIQHYQTLKGPLEFCSDNTQHQNWTSPDLLPARICSSLIEPLNSFLFSFLSAKHHLSLRWNSFPKTAQKTTFSLHTQNPLFVLTFTRIVWMKEMK